MKKLTYLVIIAIPFLALGCTNDTTIMQSSQDNTNLPTNTQPSLNSDTPTITPAQSTPRPTAEYVASELLVSFKSGTSPERIMAIIKEVNGTIEGTVDNRSFYKVTLTSTAGVDPVPSTITKLKTYQEVSIAEPNRIIRIPDCSTGPC